MSKMPPTKPLSKFQKLSLLGKVRDGIVTQKYKPGERLNETSLAREFQVTRITVREALMQLEEHGLVIHQPRRGMFVNNLSELETQQINGVRIVLEAEVLALCRANATREMIRHLEGLVVRMERWQAGTQLEAAELDLEFHRAIWRHSGNTYLAKTLNSLLPILFAHRALEGINDDRLRWILGRHRRLLDFIEGNTQDSAEATILDHLQTGYTNPERFSSLVLETTLQSVR
jgi:DNA-binding GntR family transcriptional regulator